MKILFVCTGNTCRSPMAEGLMRQLVAAEGLDVEVKSAGIAAFPGAPASRNTDLVLRNRGIALPHASQLVTPELVEWADVILTMTMSHKDMVIRTFPQSIPKTFTIGEYSDEDLEKDVMDPFGGSLEIYQQTEKELEALLHKIVKKIK